jgi:hypothetical protein
MSDELFPIFFKCYLRVNYPSHECGNDWIEGAILKFCEDHGKDDKMIRAMVNGIERPDRYVKGLLSRFSTYQAYKVIVIERCNCDGKQCVI